MAGIETGAPNAAELDRDGAAAVPPGCAGRAVAGGTPAGFALRLDGEMLRIAVVGDAGTVLMELGPYPEEDVVAVWRSLAAASGLPMLMEQPEGGFAPAYPQLGRLAVGAVAERRRRLAVLSGRRPRFLARRKPGAMPRRPVIFREPELAGGRGR